MKKLVIIIIMCVISFTAHAQHFVGGNIYFEADTLNNDFVLDCYADLYYTEIDSIKNTIDIELDGNGTFDRIRTLDKVNQIQLSNTLYKVTYNQVLENIDYGTGFAIIYKETIDASSVINVNNSNFDMYVISFINVYQLSYIFQNMKRIPDFTNEIFQVHTTTDSAYLDLKSENPNVDSTTYGDYPFTGYDTISMPYFFDLGQDGKLSWDINKTGKYYVPIIITQYWGINTFSQSLPVLIVDTENRDSLAVFNINRKRPKLNVSIFPNPSQNILNLTTEKPLDEIRIYNQLGQLIKQENSISTNQMLIDVSSFSSGIYVVQVRQGAVWQSERFLKE